MKKVAFYARCSTDNQLEAQYNSIESQIDTLHHYLQVHKDEWVKSREYRDEGISGKSIDQRPGLGQMLMDAKSQKFDILLVRSIDRLTRNLVDFYSIHGTLEECNISFVSVKESFDTNSPIGRAALNILLVFAQLEREMASERTKDKMNLRAKRGKWNGGIVPLGYHNAEEEKKLIIQPEESKIIRLMFDKYLEVASCSKVAAHLNSLGYRSKLFISKAGKPRGNNPFTKNSIRACLENPIYTGKIRYGGEIYDGEHEAIISEDKFAAVQETIAKNSEANGSIKQDKYNFLLKGLVKCGECDSFMSPTHANGRNGRYFYYKCTSVMQRNKDACSVRHINAKALEAYVIKQLREISRNEALVNETISEVNRLIKEGIKPLVEDRDRLSSRLNEVRSSADRLVTALESGKASIDRIADRLKNLEGEEKELQGQLEKTIFEIQNRENDSISAELIRQTYSNFDLVFDNLTPSEKKRLVQLLIKQIIYTKDNIKIDLYEFPHIGLDLNAHSEVLDERLKWLPRQDSNLRQGG